MNLKLANNAVAQLAAPITAAQTSFSLLTGQGAKFPALSTDDYFTLTATRPDGVREVMWVTARAFDVLTVIRGKENTIALDFDTLTIVENRLTAESLLSEIHAMNSLVNVALSTFQPGIPVGSDQLRLLLVGVLGVEQLSADLASRISQIDATSAVQGSVNQRVKAATDAFIAGLLQEANARTTAIANYGYSKQDTISAISAQVQITSAQLTAYADAARQQAISQASADVRSYTYSQASINGAISASEQTLRAEFTGGPSGGPSYATQAYVQTYAYSMAQADGAIASQTADLRSTVGNNTAAIQTSATTLNGLSAQVYTKIDNNGYVTGYGLSSAPANGVPTSAFVVRADKFLFAAAGGDPTALFAIANSNGKAIATLRGSLNIGAAPDQVLPDPNMLDSAYWTRPEFDFFTYPNSAWKSTRVLSIGPSDGYIDASTQFFPVARGGTYLFEIQVFLSDDFKGQFGIFGHLPNQEWVDFGSPYRGYNLSPSGLRAQFDDNSPKGGPFDYNTTRIVATSDQTNGASGKSQIRFVGLVSAGYIQFGGIKITRVMDTSLIGDDAITAPKINVQQLSSITNILGTVDVSAAGYMRSGQSGFDSGFGWWLGNDSGVPKLSIGASDGPAMLWDGSKLIVRKATFDDQVAFFSGALPAIVANGLQGYGNLTVSTSGGTPKAYSWSIVFGSDTGQPCSYRIVSGDGTPTISLQGSVVNNIIHASITCIVTFTDGRTATALRGHDVKHGTYNQ